MSLFTELNRRNVFRVGAAYAVVAWLLIQVAETIFPLFGFDDSPARIVVIVLAIGFLPTLVFAWAFEMTPEGLKKEKDVDRSQSITPYTSKKLDRMILVALVLALSYFAFDKFVLTEQREVALERQADERLVSATEQARQLGRSEALGGVHNGDKSIAVLPFVDMSSDKDQEYMSDGIAEELLNLLAKIPELRVISRSSAFSYKGKDIRLAQVAEELHVSHILEGSVRKAGNRIRITAQLIEARSDSHLWSETYDRTLDDIFAIQDEISAAVVNQLKIKLLGETLHVRETNPEAYALYLRARHLHSQGSPEAYQQANALYKQAVAIDPDYAVAWDGLANNYLTQANQSLMESDQAFTLARGAAEKALAIDPDYALALSHLGWIAMAHDNDPVLAARFLEQAMRLDPGNPDIISNAASLLFFLGRYQQSIALNEYANARDPVNPVGFSNVGYLYMVVGRLEDAVAAYEEVLRLSPAYLGGYYYMGTALLLLGRPQAALAAMQQEQYPVYRFLGEAVAYHSLGDSRASDAALAEVIEKYEAEWAYNIAYVLAYRDEADRAFQWLDKAVEYGDTGLLEVMAKPEFANIHDDPRWLPFLESIGKSPAQLAAIEFKVSLPEGD
ncbi:MAG: tetratricopeptide repeat protein [Gammaproteobacteria bacterium]|nr:tetratricopeptide repeat protein [Gammaproteobacteria bacterium]